ncbi:class A beta-lactamase, subclass A2 [Aureispira anguillae]|uniref:beta-lactamase n=1 Tax=Aureispira anguillae TaxID=2864201 RepID=A0A915YDU5_9BACT|nr:class A beta-lactamase, subclass A2 [Aureispira anguillae]BDS11235.1 class A beta-lactamase, subclass A2 [Aureispira anguillae]
MDTLRQKIHTLLADKDATVGLAIIGSTPSDTLSINGDQPLPLQSVFKYHIALAVLNQVDKGALHLKEKIPISKADLDNNLWSPIRKKYPTGIDLPLEEILKYTVIYSDNVGCDLLLKLIGGPKVVEQYLHQAGITDLAIKYDEVTQQSVWERQYENWTTAKAANKALKVFFDNANQQLSPESHHFLWEVMKGSKTGKNCIRGYLPEDVVVAHKTGHSGKNEQGLTGAQNDIGIIFLPDGRHFYLSVLVSNSNETPSVNKKIIADIAKLTWDYFNKNSRSLTK